MPVRAKRTTPKSLLKRSNPIIINENIPPVIQTFFEKGNSDVSGGIWFSGIMNSYRLMYKKSFTQMMCLDSAFAKTAIVDFRELKKYLFVCLLSFFLLRGSANSR